MKIRTIGLALVATAFAASSALAQGTMAPIPNPPEKVKPAKHKKKHKAHHAAAAAPAKPETPAPK